MYAKSVPELRRQILELETEIKKRIEDAKKNLRSEFEAKLAEAGLHITDIYQEFAELKPSSKPIRITKSADPKYRDPETGATWSGRGRAPHWVQKIMDERKLSLKAFKVTGEFRI